MPRIRRGRTMPDIVELATEADKAVKDLAGAEIAAEAASQYLEECRTRVAETKASLLEAFPAEAPVVRMDSIVEVDDPDDIPGGPVQFTERT